MNDSERIAELESVITSLANALRTIEHGAYANNKLAGDIAREALIDNDIPIHV